MKTTLQVVAIIGSPTDPDQLLRSALGESSLEDELELVSQRHVQVRLVSWSPSEESRVFWRAVRESESAVSVLNSADVLLAVDLAGVRTAWKTRRLNPSVDAYYGVASTLKVFATRFAQTTSS